jgi:hypothetical protein
VDEQDIQEARLNSTWFGKSYKLELGAVEMLRKQAGA